LNFAPGGEQGALGGREAIEAGEQQGRAVGGRAFKDGDDLKREDERG